MRADHLGVTITMCHSDTDPMRHRCHLAIDQAAYGVTAAATAPVDSGRIFCVSHRGDLLTENDDEP